jgi:sugar-phosphatase
MLEPQIKVSFKGLLFDLDGTLIHSIAAVDRAWRSWAVEFGLDPDYIAPRIHGRRAVDSIRALAPNLDQEVAFARLEHLEATDTAGVVAIAGAVEFLASLGGIPWGIVTSGTEAIAIPRLSAGGIIRPNVFITANQVSQGKPHPAPFLAGARALGLDPAGIIAFEDTLAGVRSAHAAGMRVVGLTEEAAAESDWFMTDYVGASVAMERHGEEATLLISSGQNRKPSVY